MRSVSVLRPEVDAGVFLYWCAQFKRWDRSLNLELTNQLTKLSGQQALGIPVSTAAITGVNECTSFSPAF